MSENTLLTLSEIKEQPEVNQDLAYFRNPANRPTKLDLDLSDISRRFAVSGQTIKDWSERPEDSFFTRQWKGAVAGVARTGQQIGNLPQEFKNLNYRYSFANASPEMAEKLMEMGLRRQIARGEARAYHEHYEGTDDSIAANISGAFASALGYGAVAAVAGLAGGPVASSVAVGVLSGVQATVETAEQYAEKYAQKTGDFALKDYDKTADAIALGYGAVSGFIESSLGVESQVANLFKRTTRRTLARAVGGFAEEGVEEGLQEFLGGVAGKIAGYEDRDWNQITKDSLESAVYGAIVGGTLGGSLYYVHRNRLARQFQKLGFDTSDARKLSDALIDDTMDKTTREAFTVESMQNKIGEPYNALVNKIETALNNAGWKEKITDPDTGITRDVKEYANIVASDLSMQVLNQAQINKIPANAVLNLADIDVVDNIVSLKPLAMGNSQQIQATIDQKKAQIKEINAKAKLLQGDPDRKKTLQTQIAVLKTLKDRKIQQENAQTEARKTQLKDMGLENATADARSDIKLSLTRPKKLKGERLSRARLYDVVKDDTAFEKVITSPEYTKIASVVDSRISEIESNPALKADLQQASKRLVDMGDGDFATIITQQPKTGGNIFGQNALIYAMKFGDVNQVNAFIDTIQGKTRENVFGATFEPNTFTQNDLYAQALRQVFPESFDENGLVKNREIASVFLSQNQQTEQNRLLQEQRTLADDISREQIVAALNKVEKNILNYLDKKDIRYDSLVSHSVNRYGEVSYYIKTGIGEIRISDHINSPFFNLSNINKTLEGIGKEDINKLTNEVIESINTLVDWEKNGSPEEKADIASFTPEFVEKYADMSNNQKRKQDPVTKFLGHAPSSRVMKVLKDKVEEYKRNKATLIQEQQSLANENARLDDIYPAYTGETINIDGKERTVYNSNGDRIAKSEPALRNFYKWFGDSKVVDEQGRPLVVYHGSDISGIEIFDVNANAIKQRQIGADRGYFFTNSKKVAERFRTAEQQKAEAQYYIENTVREPVDETKYDSQGRPIGTVHYVKTTPAPYKNFGLYAVYLKAENINEFNGEEIGTGVERDFALGSAKANGKDGVIIYKADTGAGIANEYIVFEPNQIKSVNNRGTFSEDTGNIYFQSAYAGSRVDYDQPSLEAIGSGEGNQAHGWGLYYALKPEIAERYRKSFLTGDSLYESYSYNGGNLSYIEDTVVADIAEKVISTKKTKQEIIKDKIAEIEKDIQINRKGLETAESEDAKSFRREQIEDSEEALQFLNKLNPDDIVIKSGQVHEVDIPEMDVLLDEQKTFAEQSDFVKEQLAKIGSKYLFDMTGLSESEKITEASHIMKDWTGGQIYRALAENRKSDKNASQMLEKYGIKGITYDGRQDGRCFVIFNPESVKVLRKKFDELGNMLFQSSDLTQGNYGGLYDPELNVIVLGKDFNTGTLPHELAHFWLQDIFNRYKSNANWTPEFTQQTANLFKILGVKETQTALTTEQHEHFARMTEAVIFGLATPPEGTNLPMLGYLNWIPPKYKSLQAIRYKDEQGRMRYPVLDNDAVSFFNQWYANPFMPTLGVDAPDSNDMENPNGQPALPSTVAERAEKIKSDVDAQNAGDRELDRYTRENAPVATQARMTAYEVDNARKVSELNKKREEVLNPEKTSWLKLGRGTNKAENIRTIATDYVKKNKEHAESIAFGNPDQTSPDFVQNDSGIDRISLIREVMKGYEKGSREYYALYRNMADEATLAGKTTGLNNDISFQFYRDGYQRMYSALELRAAVAYSGTKGDPVTKFNRDIDAFIANRVDQILSLPADSAERNNAIDSMIREAEVQFAGDSTDSRLLLQENTLGQTATPKQREAFIAWANKYIKDHLVGADSKLDEGKLITLSDKAQVAYDDINATDPEKAIAAANVIKEWQRFTTSLNPSPSWFATMLGQWSPMAMLLSVNPHVLNIASTGVNRAIIKGAMNRAFKQYGNKVDQNVAETEHKRIKQIFDATLLDYAQMVNPLTPALLHGEKIRIGKDDITITADDKLHTMAFKGVKYLTYGLFGKEDFFYRSRAYIEALSYIATRDAKGDATVATTLFKEYAQVNSDPKSQAYKARKEAIDIANMTTFIENGSWARAITKIRTALNQLTGNPDVGLGTILAPFAKVPTNVIQQGFKSLSAPFRAAQYGVRKAKGIKDVYDFNDWKNAITFMVEAIIAGIVAGAGDYEPPYDPSEHKKYDPKKPYDSIGFNIGGKKVWVKLDVFASMETPLRIMAMALTGKGLGIKESIDSVPLLGDLGDFIKDAGQATTNKQKALRFGASFTYDIVDRQIPAIFKQVMSAANAADAGFESIDLGVKTGVGRRIERRYGLDGDTRSAVDLLNDIGAAIGLNRFKLTE